MNEHRHRLTPRAGLRASGIGFALETIVVTPLSAEAPAAPEAVTRTSHSAPLGDVFETISAQNASHYLRGIRELHGEAGLDALLTQHGIPPALMRTPLAPIAVSKVARLLAHVQRRTRDEFVGLSAAPVRLGTFALAARSMLRCASLGEALETGFGIYRLALPDFNARLRISQRPGLSLAHVALSIRTEFHAATTPLHSAFLYSVRGMASWLIRQRIPILEICLRSDTSMRTPRETGSRPVFDVPVRFHAGASCLSFDARWLSQPISADAAALRPLLRAMPAPLLVPFRDRSRLREQVRLRIKAQLGGDLPTLEQTAWALKLSPHVLRRRLLQEGRSFQEIKNDLRRDIAIDRLANSDARLAEIAFELGFSECSAFHRGFKQWTGLSPGEYRLAHWRSA